MIIHYNYVKGQALVHKGFPGAGQFGFQVSGFGKIFVAPLVSSEYIITIARRKGRR